jgi:hypothetical protein
MTKSTALTLLSGFLLSCSSSGGGGGGGLTEATANQRFADSYCAAAFRCKDGPLGTTLLLKAGNPKDQTTCSMGVKASLVAANGKDVPCKSGLFFDAAAGQKCLDLLASAVCTNVAEVTTACDDPAVCKTTPPAGSGGSGSPGSGGMTGSGGSSNPGSGGSTSPGSGGSAGGDTCTPCVLQNCATQVGNCSSVPDCSSLVDCTDACSDQTCFDNCGAQHQGSISLYNAIVQCVRGSCAAVCGGQ